MAFDFQLSMWENYKKIYLDRVEQREEDGMAKFYMGMKKAWGM